MRVFGLIRQFQRLSRYQDVKLTTKEQDRLRALALWQETREVDLACQTFGLSRASLYRWRKRLDPKDLTSIQDRSRRPHRLRRPTWSLDLQQAVKRLRETYPRWGKDKLVVLLRREGLSVSTSMVGRILTYLKQHHRLIESPRFTLSARKRRLVRPYAIRKPSNYIARRPPRRSDPDRYLGSATGPGGDSQAVHGTRCDLPLGCPGSPSPRHSTSGLNLPAHPPRAHALSHPSFPS
ncbi:MAG: helix-turn-helix domain-containing protein [Nitrospira sp.]|nr:helix-turn-helix domain-containing protein [Nitrospira sp.]